MLRVRALLGNWQPALPGRVAFHGAHVAIQLVNAGNYRGSAGTIGRKGGWRADRQPSPSTAFNIQIQKDNVRPPSSVACLLVPAHYSLRLFETGSGDARSRTRFRELTNIINEGLNKSVSSRRQNARGHWEIQPYRVEGTFSS